MKLLKPFSINTFTYDYYSESWRALQRISTGGKNIISTPKMQNNYGANRSLIFSNSAISI